MLADLLHFCHMNPLFGDPLPASLFSSSPFTISPLFEHGNVFLIIFPQQKLETF